MTAAPTCRRCGAPLAHSYRTHLVTAGEQLLETAPDGNSHAAVLAATSACSWNCLAVLAAQLAGPDADAAVLVVAERERQVTAEGWTPEHDDSHPAGELAAAGAFYALAVARGDGNLVGPGELRHTPEGPDLTDVIFTWPWDGEWWKPKDPERDLVRAGALVAAEADRLVRARRDRF